MLRPTTPARGRAAALAVALASAWPAQAPAQLVGPVWSLEGEYDFGSVVVVPGDVNGDGWADLLVGWIDWKVLQFYLGTGGSPPFSSEPAWVRGWRDNPQLAYGRSIAPAGDVNADGYADFLVGASRESTVAERGGRAYLFLGSPAGPLESGWVVSGEEEQQLGTDVGTAGDVNGDGYDDVIIGEDPLGWAGSARVYHGSPSGLPAQPSQLLPTSPNRGAWVATAGDVNGDGYDDVLIGGPVAPHWEDPRGRAYLYLGSREGLLPEPAWTAYGSSAFGTSVTSAGDVNGDGYGDILVGEPAAYEVWQDQTAYVYHGSRVGPSESPDWTVAVNDATLRTNERFLGAGDVDGDGYSDVMFLVGGQDALLFRGSAAGLSSVPSWRSEGPSPDALWMGDLSGDGLADVVLGATSSGIGGRNQVSVYLGTCLDADGDHICDAEDDCPTEYGEVCTEAPIVFGERRETVVYLGTCVDADGDHICDAEDGCPTEYGEVCEDPPVVYGERGGCACPSQTPSLALPLFILAGLRPRRRIREVTS